MKKEQKSEKYFELQSRVEAESLVSSRMLWQIDKVGQFNSFTVSAYMIDSGQIILTQNFWNGSGIFVYLPDGENTFDGSRRKIQSLNVS